MADVVDTSNGCIVDVNNGEEEYVVDINNLSFSYTGDHKVLKNIDLQIKKGTIVSLLAPSGAGKTTLISLILGLLAPKTGSLKVNVTTRDIGYLPQYSGVFDRLTIADNVLFFANLYGVEGDVKGKAQEIMTFLGMEDISMDRVLNTLSGGQRRRVALATALLHKPKLLLLDECLAGLDVVSRERVMKYLRLITQESGVTVIQTDHNLESAMRGDEVIFMREGHILDQNHPMRLLDKYQCDNLNDVFLLLATHQEKVAVHTVDENGTVINEYPLEVTEKIVNDEVNEKRHSQVNIGDADVIAMTASTLKRGKPRFVSGIFRKHAKTLVSSRRLLMFSIMMPIFMMIILNSVLGGSVSGVSVGWVDSDDSALSASFTALMKEEKELYSLTQYTTMDLALDNVIEAGLSAIVHLPVDFGASLTNVSLDIPIDIRLDYADQSVAVELRQKLVDIMSAFLTNNFGQSAPTLPLSFDNGLYMTSVDDTLADFLTPGLFVFVVYIMSIIFLANLFISYRQNGCLERMYVAGVQARHLVLGYFSPQIILLIVQIFLAAATAFIIFDVEVKGSIPLLFVVLIILSIVSLALGVFISTFSGNDSLASFLLVILSVIPALLLSGIISSVDILLPWIRYFTYLIPTYYATNCSRSITTRGLGFMDIWRDFAALVAFGIVIILLCMRKLRSKL
ncbi:hypothetical protein PCE1_003442 [Barthelona sp. PCE]